MSRRSATTPGAPTVLDRALLVVGVGLAYAVGAIVSWQTLGADVGIAFFPAAGVTVAALLLSRRQDWPLVLVTIVVVEIAVDLAHSVGVGASIGYAAANAVEPLVGAIAVLSLQSDRLDIRRRHDATVFVLGAAIIGPVAGAIIGSTTKTLSDGGPWLQHAALWWAGDGVGVIAIGMPVMMWQYRREVTRRAELAVAIVVLVTLTTLIHLSDLPNSLAPLPILVWAAFRLGVESTVLLGGIYALCANYMTAHGWGSVAALDRAPASRLAIMQLVVTVLLVVGYSLAIEIRERALAAEQQLRAERERDTAQSVATVLQLAVQPEIPAMVPNFRVASRYQPASDESVAGGDWCDVAVLPDDSLFVIVGDVVGHGLDAIEDMAQLRFAGRALAAEEHSPGMILSQLTSVSATMTHGKFATALVGIFDPQTKQFTYASAGHPSPVLSRAGHRRAHLCPLTPGPPLGTESTADYLESIIRVEDDDLLVLYTDGLVERRRTDILSGMDRLCRTVDGLDRRENLASLSDRVVQESIEGTDHIDDVCVLILRAEFQT